MGGIQFEANQHSRPLLSSLLLVSSSSLVLPPSRCLSLFPSTFPTRVRALLLSYIPYYSHPPPPFSSSFRYISPPDPLLAIYHSKSRTIRSRVRNTGILESFEPLRPPPVDILAYLPVFTRTTRLELVRALASLLMQLSD